MKKIILNILLAILVLGGETAVFADTSLKPSDAEERANRELERMLPKLKEQDKKLREEGKINVEEKINNSIVKKIEGRFEKMATRYLQTIEREEKIMAKIVSRIEKIKLDGGATTRAEKQGVVAKTQ